LEGLFEAFHGSRSARPMVDEIKNKPFSEFSARQQAGAEN